MSAAVRFKRGQRVLVPWGLGEPRDATVVEVWGEPSAPTQIRVTLAPREPDEEQVTLLLNPDVLILAA